MDPFAVRSLVREFALGFPGAYEEFPWGESVAKVKKKVFVFLGHEDADTAGTASNSRIPRSMPIPWPCRAQARPGTGWVRQAGCRFLRGGTPSPELLCEWVEESYRVVAPKRRVTELDASK
jgi:predicted DNA-binding protein (MmcQ/YjbR family)